MIHPHQHAYPVICHEFGTRFFDQDLVAAVIESDREFYADPVMKQYIQEGDVPMIWDEMSLLEQINVQIGFVAPPPRSDVSLEDEMSADDKWAAKVHGAIVALNAA